MYYKLLLILTLSFSVFAGESFLVGEFQSISENNEHCGEEVIASRFIKEGNERILSFGTRLTWTLTNLDKGKTEEKVERGCTYLTEYELLKNSLAIKTTRTKCPHKQEETVIQEKFELKNAELTYSRDEKDKQTICRYKKIK